MSDHLRIRGRRSPYIPVSVVFLAGAAQLPNFPKGAVITKIRAQATSTPAVPGAPPIGAIQLDLPWSANQATPVLRLPCGDKGVHVLIDPLRDLAVQGSQVRAQYAGWAGGVGGEFIGVIFFDWEIPETKENEQCQ